MTNIIVQTMSLLSVQKEKGKMKHHFLFFHAYVLLHFSTRDFYIVPKRYLKKSRDNNVVLRHFRCIRLSYTIVNVFDANA